MCPCLWGTRVLNPGQDGIGVPTTNVRDEGPTWPEGALTSPDMPGKKKIQAMYKVKTVKSENEKFLPHLTVLK